MKMTLLEIVQAILNALDGEPVNSITDTVESEQVAMIVRDSYLALVSNRNWPHTRHTLSLSSFSDDQRPTHMSFPDSVKEIELVNYNKKKQRDTRQLFEQVYYLHPDQFLEHTNNRDTDSDNVTVVEDLSGVSINIQTNCAPTYYTSFDDENIVFDSFDKEVELTLQSSKTQAIVVEQPTFSLVDNHVPDLPTEAFSALLEDSKSTASLQLRQIPDQKAEQRAQQQRNWLAREAFVVNGGVRYNNYGRSGRTGSRAVLHYDSPRFPR